MIRRLGSAVPLAILALLACALTASAAQLEVPVATPGAPLPADGPAASLLRPTTLHATFRVPPADDALYVGTPWFVRELTVTIVGPGAHRRTIAAAANLPGAMLGLRLPSDAWRADRIQLEATSVSSVAPPYLLSGAQLARVAARSWWYAACFGTFLALAIVLGGAAFVLRSEPARWFACAAAAQAGLTIPWLGIVRPAPDVSQPLHALLQSIAYVACARFALAFVGALDARTLRIVHLALRALVGVNIVAVCGADVLQDLWPVPDVLTQLATVALDAAFVAIAVFGTVRRVAGARLYLFATTVGFASLTIALVPATPPSVVQSAPLLGTVLAFVAFALAAGERLRDEQLRRAREANGARLDGLTGLPNRDAFEQRIAAAWRGARRTHDAVGMVLVDVDQLHAYNDAYGHLAGDDVLRRVGEAVAAIAERARTAAFRYGGEEFAVVCAHADTDAVRALAENVRAAVARMEIAHGAVASKRLSVSAGVACAAPDAHNGEHDLVRRVSDALYVAKSMGRNRVVVDEPAGAYASNAEPATASFTTPAPSARAGTS